MLAPGSIGMAETLDSSCCFAITPPYSFIQERSYKNSLYVCSIHALNVGCGIGLDPDDIASADEERHLHDQTCFQRGGLGSTSSRIAFEARLGIGHAQVHCGWRLNGERLLIIADQFKVQAIEQVIVVLAKLRGGEGNLLKRLGVHEVVEVAVLILKLDSMLIQINAGKLFA